MKFGQKVLVECGGSLRSGTPGSRRLVPGVLVFRRGHECLGQAGGG